MHICDTRGFNNFAENSPFVRWGGFLPEIINTYSELLDLRNAADYELSPVKIDFKSKAEQMLPAVRRMVKLLESAI